MVGVPLLEDYSQVGDAIFDLPTNNVRNAIPPETIFEPQLLNSVISQSISQERALDHYVQQSQPVMQQSPTQVYNQRPNMEAVLLYHASASSNLYNFPYDDILHYLLSREDVCQDFVASGLRMETPNLKDRSVSSSISMSGQAPNEKMLTNDAWQGFLSRKTQRDHLNPRISQHRWKVNATRAKLVSDSVNASIDREFEVLWQYKLNYYNQVLKPPVSRRRRNPNCIQWKLVSVFKMYTNLVPKEIENTNYYDQIPLCSCFGTINMRSKGAWRRFSGST